MAENIILYGPPGTGKTHYMQELCQKKYTDYTIDDTQISTIYARNSASWILLTLVLLQKNEPMTSNEIAQKLATLGVGTALTPSTELNKHNITPGPLGNTRPEIFFEDRTNNTWFIDINRLLSYENDFFEKYSLVSSISKRYEFVTFHQSFVYEDFVEGIRPNVTNNVAIVAPGITSGAPTVTTGSTPATTGTAPATSGSIGYSIQDGVFKKLCDLARSNRMKRYAIFIDEINRGNIAEIFGELITLIETDKRDKLAITLPYSKSSSFTVPENLDIYGTMNSADRSIANLDFALRRRFKFRNFTCDYNALESILRSKGVNPHNVAGIDVIQLLRTINDRIELILDSNYIVGHANFANVSSLYDVISVIKDKVIPLLEEYFYDDPQKIQLILNDLDDTGALHTHPIYCHRILGADLIRYNDDYNFEEKKQFYVTDTITLDSVTKIYNP